MNACFVDRSLLHDACALIDVGEMDLIDYLFRLPYQMLTTNFIWEDELDNTLKAKLSGYINSGSFNLMMPDIEALEKMNKLRSENPGLSIYDCSALVLAMEGKAILVTGDALLRKTAIETGCIVHGTLWILEELITHNILEPNAAAGYLRKLMEVNARLPQPECKLLLSKWESSRRS